MKYKYTIKKLAEEEFLPFFDKHKHAVFEDVHSFSLQDLLSDKEQEKLKALEENMGQPYKLFLGAFDEDNELVGWTWGQQEGKSTFYMVNSAVLEGHRCKGVYSALVRECIDQLAEKGFQIIYSRHCSTNNAVIIPKLKAGFIISKMEVDDRYGVLIHLHYYTNEDRRRIMDYRSGQLFPDEKMKKLFKL